MLYGAISSSLPRFKWRTLQRWSLQLFPRTNLALFPFLFLFPSLFRTIYMYSLLLIYVCSMYTFNLCLFIRTWCHAQGLNACVYVVFELHHHLMYVLLCWCLVSMLLCCTMSTIACIHPNGERKGVRERVKITLCPSWMTVMMTYYGDGMTWWSSSSCFDLWWQFVSFLNNNDWQWCEI